MWELAGRIVPVDQDLLAFRLVQDVKVSDSLIGIDTGSLQKTHQTTADCLNAVRFEEVWTVLEAQTQALPRDRYEAQRVVSGIVPLDAGEAQAGDRLLKDASINRVVLEDDDAVEQAGPAGQTTR